MGYIAVDQLKPGMVLAEEVRDVNSRLLLPKGIEVETKHIRMFKMWGIGDVDVAGDQDGDTGEDSKSDPDQLEKVAMVAKDRFKFNDLSHPLIKEIFTQSVLYQCKENQVPDIKGKVESDYSTDEKSTPDIMAALQKRDLKLPEMPSIVYELNEVAADPFSSADDIAQVVTKSPSLSTLILKIVNSAFYGFPSRIDSITRAVALIGSKEISALGMGISTMKLFEGIPEEIVDLKSFFKHSLACGIMSRMFAAQLNIQHTEQLFVAGLLHDIGRVIIYKYYPEESKAMLYDALQAKNLIYNVEPGHLGCRHTHIGKKLFSKWKLPFSLENSAYYHHKPSSAPDPLNPTIVHLADICAHAMGLGSTGEVLVPKMDNKAIDALSITPGALKNVLNQAVNQINFLENMFTDHE